MGVAFSDPHMETMLKRRGRERSKAEFLIGVSGSMNLATYLCQRKDRSWAVCGKVSLLREADVPIFSFKQWSS